LYFVIFLEVMNPEILKACPHIVHEITGHVTEEYVVWSYLSTSMFSYLSTEMCSYLSTYMCSYLSTSMFSYLSTDMCSYLSTYALY
jgi:hypothetical protein